MAVSLCLCGYWGIGVCVDQPWINQSTSQCIDRSFLEAKPTHTPHHRPTTPSEREGSKQTRIQRSNWVDWGVERLDTASDPPESTSKPLSSSQSIVIVVRAGVGFASIPSNKRSTQAIILRQTFLRAFASLLGPSTIPPHQPPLSLSASTRPAQPAMPAFVRPARMVGGRSCCALWIRHIGVGPPIHQLPLGFWRCARFGARRVRSLLLLVPRFSPAAAPRHCVGSIGNARGHDLPTQHPLHYQSNRPRRLEASVTR